MPRVRAAGRRLPPVALGLLVKKSWLFSKLVNDNPELLGTLGNWLHQVRSKGYAPEKVVVPAPAPLADWPQAEPAVAWAVAELRAADPTGSRSLLAAAAGPASRHPGRGAA